MRPDLPPMDVVLERLHAMRPVEFQLSAFVTFTLIGHLQLALRHPGNVGPSAAIAETIARKLQEGLAVQDADVAAALEAGWNPDDDEIDI